MNYCNFCDNSVKPAHNTADCPRRKLPEPSSAREWWICEPSDHDISEGVIYNYCVPADIAGKPVTMHPSIHVIEYSAFEQMRRERDAANEMRVLIETNRDQLRRDKVDLEQQLAEAPSTVEHTSAVRACLDARQERDELTESLKTAHDMRIKAETKVASLTAQLAECEKQCDTESACVGKTFELAERYREALERIVNLKLQRAQPLEEEIARAALKENE